MRNGRIEQDAAPPPYTSDLPRSSRRVSSARRR